MKSVKLSISSVPEIYALYKNDFKDGWTEEMLTSAFETGRFNVYGVYDDTLLVGVISFSVTIDTADLEDVYVLPSYRQKGLASDLFCDMEKFIIPLGVKKLFLEVRKFNAPAISFYQKQGMVKISERKKYYSDGEDALVFVKEY